MKLGDFGVSRFLPNRSAKAKTNVGTVYYQSPELCLGEPYNDKTDVWSIGIVLFELCTFKLPFDGKSIMIIYKKLMEEYHGKIPEIY